MHRIGTVRHRCEDKASIFTPFWDKNGDFSFRHWRHLETPIPLPFLKISKNIFGALFSGVIEKPSRPKTHTTGHNGSINAQNLHWLVHSKSLMTLVRARLFDSLKLGNR